jgi:hypothetical protein
MWSARLKIICAIIVPFFLVLVFLACLPVFRAEAHVLETDGPINATLHIDPDDDPVAGEPASLHLYVESGTSTLDLTKCDCAVELASGEQALFSGNTQTSIGMWVSGGDTEFSYTFPSKGVYTLVLTGKPVSGTTFPGFSLTYDIRVDKEASQKQPSPWSSFPQDRNTNSAIAAVTVIIAGALLGNDMRTRHHEK